MKIFSIITLTGCLLIVLITGCGEELADDIVDHQSNDLLPDSDKYYSVLERVLRDMLNKAPDEELTTDELATVKRLAIPYVLDPYEVFAVDLDLTLLPRCINLTQLNLSGNQYF